MSTEQAPSVELPDIPPKTPKPDQFQAKPQQKDGLVSMRLPVWMLERATKLAGTAGITRSELMRRIIHERIG